MSARRNDDPAGTIRLDEADLVEMHSAVDLFAPFPEDARAQQEATAHGVPHPIHQAPTRQAAAWDIEPARAAAAAREPQPETPNEITAVRKPRKGTKEREWVDLHAVVDEEGRLRLPEHVAKQLQVGAIVQVRVAGWAIADDVK